MKKGDIVFVSLDNIYWYDAIFEYHSIINGFFYVRGYDRGLRYCKSKLDYKKDRYIGNFNHYNLFFC